MLGARLSRKPLLVRLSRLPQPHRPEAAPGPADAEKIGITLSEEDQLDSEQLTYAIVVHSYGPGNFQCAAL
jgi:hypothetical protein